MYRSRSVIKSVVKSFLTLMRCQAANQRKFDDWYAMYCILEDQYFKEVKCASNTPPELPSGNFCLSVFCMYSVYLSALLLRSKPINMKTVKFYSYLRLWRQNNPIRVQLVSPLSSISRFSDASVTIYLVSGTSATK